MNLKNRVMKLEAAIQSRPCPACAALPRVALIDGPDDRRRFERQLQRHAAGCTCGSGRSVKLIVLH